MKQQAKRIEDARGMGRMQPESDLGGPALRAFFNLSERWKLRVAEQRVQCPECAEWIQPQANICRFCGHRLQ